MNALLGYIHEIGRGPRGARDLPEAAAGMLWQAILDARLSPAAIGAALMAMRLKGESLDELRALREAAHARLPSLAPIDAPLVCMPCYNGARRQPNLSWLTALALRQAGFAVLMHGVRHDPGRVASCEVAEAAGGPVVGSVAAARDALSGPMPVFLPIDVWCPPLAAMLALRFEMGVRNTAHTVAKLLRPTADALMLCPITHSEYLDPVVALLGEDPGPALVFRGVDGEPTLYPHVARRLYRIEAGAGTGPQRLRESEASPEVVPDPAIRLPAAASPEEVAQWSASVMRGSEPMPSMTAALVRHAASAVGLIAQG